MRLIVISALLFMALPGLVYAQRSRGSEVELLRRTEVHAELGLSEEQSKKLQELQAKSTTSREDFDAYRKQLEAAKSKEEEKEIRDAFSKKVVESRTLFQDNALSVLNEAQRKALRGLYLKNTGPRGLTNDEIAAEYGLTDEQKEKLAEIASQMRTALRVLPTDASEEERERQLTEWREKMLAVLTPEQRARFEKEEAQAPSGEQQSAVASASPQPSNAPSTAEGTPGVKPPAATPPPGEKAVASFGAGSAPGEQRLVKEFSFNFRYAPWDQVLQMFADGAGLTLDLTQVPPGTFSHLDDHKYTAKQALDIMNGYLLRKGFGLFEKDGFLIVLNLDEGIPPSLLRDVTVEELLSVNPVQVGNNELVNVTFEVKDMDTAKAAQEIEPLIGPWGSLIALTESNLLIVTDIGANLRRIHRLLNQAMAQSKPDALVFKSYFLRHMDAEEAMVQVMTQFGMRQNVENVSQFAEERSRLAARSQARTQATRPAPSSGSNAAEPELQVAADIRLNSLLVTGTARQHELVETILKALDVDEDASGNPLTRGRRGTYLEVYQLHSSDATEVAKTLSAMNMPGVKVVNEDARHGRVHIMANERQHEEIAALIRQLDGAASSGSVAVIQLHQMDPLSAAATLRSLFYADGDDAPTIETDLYGRRLIVRGSVDQLAQIRKVLADLGESGGPRERDGGRVRRVPLQGRDPEKFLRILKQEWESREGSRLNILMPEEEGPVKSRQTSDGELDSDRPEKPESPRSDTTPRRPAPDVSQRSGHSTRDGNGEWGTWQSPAPTLTSASLVSQDDETEDNGGEGSSPAGTDLPAPSDGTVAEKNNPDSDSKSAVSNATGADETEGQRGAEVIVLGDELIITSPNEEELDRLEDLLDMLQQTLPFKQEYTQFFLKSADALEASDMLSQFFPSSSVSTPSAATGGSLLGGLGSSLGGLGSSLMDATGLSGLGATSNSLRIIPDVRTNSLFLAGPPMMVKDAISLLKVLDSNDGPESLKDMQARSLAVQYADVREVKSVLDDLFKTYLEAQNQGRGQQQQNPLAAMFGAAGGAGGRGNPASQVRMHLAIDEQNSLILVNSSQELYDEVKEVVEELDRVAKDANRLIRVIQLKNADASLIQSSLSALMPRVTISSSRTGSSSSSGSGGSSSGSSGGNDAAKAAAAQQEAIQRAFQERLRQRFGGGGGGATPGRGGAFPGGGGRGPGTTRGFGGRR